MISGAKYSIKYKIVCSFHMKYIFLPGVPHRVQVRPINRIEYENLSSVNRDFNEKIAC